MYISEAKANNSTTPRTTLFSFTSTKDQQWLQKMDYAYMYIIKIGQFYRNVMNSHTHMGVMLSSGTCATTSWEMYNTGLYFQDTYVQHQHSDTYVHHQIKFCEAKYVYIHEYNVHFLWYIATDTGGLYIHTVLGII